MKDATLLNTTQNTTPHTQDDTKHNKQRGLVEEKESVLQPTHYSSSSYPFSEYDTIKRNKNIKSHTATQHSTNQLNAIDLSIHQLIE